MWSVVVNPPDPTWAFEFEAIAAEIKIACGTNLLDRHHIGSTSVLGKWAKPIIDVLAVIADLDELDRTNLHFLSLGFEPMGEFGIPGRRYFRRNDVQGNRTHQIHAFAFGSPDIERHLAFRDYLQADDVAATDYSNLKRYLALLNPFDIEGYMDGKDLFVKAVETRALEWRHRSAESTDNTDG